MSEVKLFKIRYKSVDNNRYEKRVITRDYKPIEKFLNQVYDVDHPIMHIEHIEMEDAFHDEL